MSIQFGLCKALKLLLTLASGNQHRLLLQRVPAVVSSTVKCSIVLQGDEFRSIAEQVPWHSGLKLVADFEKMKWVSLLVS